MTVSADPAGYQALVELAAEHGPLRAWAMEGAGGYGAGLAAHLVQRDETRGRASRGHRGRCSTGPC
jgi:transposase